MYFPKHSAIELHVTIPGAEQQIIKLRAPGSSTYEYKRRKGWNLEAGVSNVKLTWIPFMVKNNLQDPRLWSSLFSCYTSWASQWLSFHSCNYDILFPGVRTARGGGGGLVPSLRVILAFALQLRKKHGKISVRVPKFRTTYRPHIQGSSSPSSSWTAERSVNNYRSTPRPRSRKSEDFL
jgi:hypothetical protein